VPCTAEEFARHDVLVVSTAHSDFKAAHLYSGVRLVVDTRNLMAPLGLGGPGAPGPEVFRA
jgi:UDP-N-acetyl-D-mannosaminuronate dehydrogenase